MGGLWTLQASIFPENRVRLGLRHQAGFCTVGEREGIAQHHGRWRDTALLQRCQEIRLASGAAVSCGSD